MTRTAQAFIQKLESEGLNYYPPEENEGKTVLAVGFGLENTKVQIHIIFDENEHTVAIRCIGFITVNEKQFPQALLCCNELNKNVRWVKFVIDDDMDVNAEDDAIVDEETSGEEVFELVIRMCKILDDAYPQFMGAIYGQN